MITLNDRETLKVLKSARALRPELAETLDLHIAILEARGELPITNYKLQIQTGEARARVERGEPLLRADELALDWDALARLFREICHIAAKHQPEQRDAFVELAEQAASESFIREAARQYLDTRPSVQPPTSNLQSSHLQFALNNALHPFLSARARQMQSLVDDASWYRAYCPICGGAPDFSALEKESGARRLLCARCDTEWTFHRAVCPFCSADGKLNYFPSADGAYRLYVCESCKHYLKTIDRRELAREVNLAAERVLTLGMDVAARQAGYA